VAQRNLEDDSTGRPIRHPALDHFFQGFQDGVYIPNKPTN
jgi:hemimethylated DNA binding protein